jgi:putative PIN family toxin of toxin-antitoxin system
LKIVLDTTILVRAHERSSGIARDLLLSVLESGHTLLLSNEILYELAKVLRYPRLQAFYGLSEESVFRYVHFLRRFAELVTLHPLVMAPIRDVTDQMVIQTAILGEADILCTTDKDFFEEPACEYLRGLGISAVDDVTLIKRLRS